MKQNCWKGKRFKLCSFSQKYKKAGRNSSGRITMYHRGGGSKRLLRRIDFKRNIFSTGVVERIEYDPNRSARIALVKWVDSETGGLVSPKAARRATTLKPIPRTVVGPPVEGDQLSSPVNHNQASSKGTEVDKVVRLTSPGTRPSKSISRLPSILSNNIGVTTPGDDSRLVEEGNEAQDVARRGCTTLLVARCESSTGPKRRSKGDVSRPPFRKTRLSSLAPPGSKKRSKGFFSYILACDKLQLQATIINSFCQRDISNITHTLAVDASRPVTRPGLATGANDAPGSRSTSGTSVPVSATSTPQQLSTTSTLVTTPSYPNGIQTSSAIDKMYQQVGNCIPLGFIPIGTFVHNIEERPGQGGQLVRAAGTFAQLVQKVENTQQSVVRLPSGILKQLDSECRATIGIVSNSSHNTIKLTKAGQNRWLGKRPIVRGVAMNPIDHPHGGGEGRSKGGRPSVSPWGKPTKGGFKTVIRKRATSVLQLRSKKNNER